MKTMTATKTTKTDWTRVNDAARWMLYSVQCGFARHEAFAHVAKKMALTPAEVTAVTVALPS